MTDFLLQAKWTSSLAYQESDSGSHASMDVRIVIPSVPDGWYCIGMRAAGGGPADSGKHLIVRPHPDSYAEPLAEMALTGWWRVWGKRGNGNSWGLWTPKDVPNGYVSLSDTWYSADDPPNYPLRIRQKAVSVDCVVPCPIGDLIWNDQGSHAHDNGSMWAVEDGSGTLYKYFRAQRGYDKPGGTAWALNMSKVEIVS